MKYNCKFVVVLQPISQLGQIYMLTHERKFHYEHRHGNADLSIWNHNLRFLLLTYGHVH